MIELGIALTTATTLILVLEYFRRRRFPFPAHGWMGLISLIAAEYLMFRGVEPIATYFPPIAWSAYILIVDAAVFSISGRSRMQKAPRAFLRMAALSVPLWLIFEAYNLRLKNWTYTGVPAFWPLGLLGYAWSFATITPAIFVTADFIQALLPFREQKPWKISRRAESTIIACGAACLVLPLVLPQYLAAYLFALIWVGFVLLDATNHQMGFPSFIGDLREGLRSRFYAFLISGWVCGWLWEFWNFWAAAKWHYIFPIFQRSKIFEMPVLGYLGFIPFALDCFCMYVAVNGLIARWSRQ
jgi:hypothetical protein